MTERELATRSGYSRSVIHRKLKKGYSVDEIVRAGQERLKQVAEVRPLAEGSARGSNSPDLNRGERPENYPEAQRRKESALADLRELELARKRGELIDAGEVETGWATVCTTIRDGMLSLPSKLADRLAPITNAQEIGAILRSEIRAELTRISKDLDAAAESS